MNVGVTVAFFLQRAQHLRGCFLGVVQDPGYVQARQDPLDHPGREPGLEQPSDLQHPVHQALVVVPVAVRRAAGRDQILLLVAGAAGLLHRPEPETVRRLVEPVVGRPARGLGERPGKTDRDQLRCRVPPVSTT